MGFASFQAGLKVSRADGELWKLPGLSFGSFLGCSRAALGCPGVLWAVLRCFRLFWGLLGSCSKLFGIVTHSKPNFKKSWQPSRFYQSKLVQSLKLVATLGILSKLKGEKMFRLSVIFRFIAEASALALLFAVWAVLLRGNSRFMEAAFPFLGATAFLRQQPSTFQRG